MRSRHREFSAAVIIIFALALVGCSVDKNTSSSRFYHSLISKYNIWFNGNEAYKSGLEKIKSSHTDDYSAILPVFEYSSEESASAASSDMERAIQKASKVIALHSITARPDEKKRKGVNAHSDDFYKQREYNDWVDDAYMLMAKAQFYRKEFMAARASFSFAVSIATDPDLVTEAGIWMSRIQDEEKKYSEAMRLLDETGDPGKMSRTLKSMYYTTQADILLQQKKYHDAIDPLINAVEYTGDKEAKVRLIYLLAQVCKAAGDNESSTKYFNQVIHMSPTYELEFNADINLAGVTDISHGDAEDIMKSLKKMIHNSKNKDYLDQIYFALGELEKRMGNTEEALKYWSQSVSASTMNTHQKARSYLAIGEYYYTQPDYMNAWKYYDSAMSIIDSRYPDYALISRKSSDLGEFAGFHTVVVTEDSLRRVAAMSDTERDAIISGIIRALMEEQTKARSGENAGKTNMGLYYENEARNRSTVSAEGSWYFYNQSALTFGRSEFKRRWGNRKLEDNWRRSNKAHSALSNGPSSEPGQERQSSDSAGVAPEMTKEYYLRNLPMTDSLLKISGRKSAAALLGEGKILASHFTDTLAAVSSLEKVLKTGDDDKIKAESLYELYRLLRNSDPVSAAKYRADLISEYPLTEYALILSDPDYLKKHQEMASVAVRRYDQAYTSFTGENYTETHAICTEALKLYPDDGLAPKFMLLDAMATGALEGEMAYKEKLDSLVKRYPGTPEGRRATEIADFLRKEIPSVKIAEDTRIAAEIYTADTLQPHYIMIIAGNTKANLNQMVFDIINYNLDNYPDKSYKTEGAAIDKGYLLITTGPFENAREAQSWLMAFKPEQFIREASKTPLTLFLISRDNLKKFREDKEIDRYVIFYTREYGNFR